MRTHALIFAASATLALPITANAGTDLCATQVQRDNIQAFYAEAKKGAPLPVASRYFSLPDVTIASGLNADNAVGAAMTPQSVRQIWSSIDAWGADSEVSLVFSVAGQHSFSIPSMVPITQSDAGDGFLDVYADNGKGIHAHLQLDLVQAVYAFDLPAGADGARTRGVSLFDPKGRLIMGVYASVRGDEYSNAAVEGFSKTYALIGSMPRMCPF